jgi:cytoskeletal protein RodZ
LSPFYYKSFVKTYSQYVGLDPQEILSRISTTPPVEAIKKIRPSSTEKNSGKVQEKVLLALAARSLDHRNGKKIAKVFLVVAAIALAAVVLFFVVKNIHNAVVSAVRQPKIEMKTKPVKKIEQVKKETLKVQPAETVPVKKTELQVPVESSKASVSTKDGAVIPEGFVSAKNGKTAEVTVRAKMNSWLSVKADGQTVFRQILKKGSSETWHASKKIEISGKDVDVLEFEVNGKSIGKLSRRDVKARKVVVTPEGLTVEK